MDVQIGEVEAAPDGQRIRASFYASDHRPEWMYKGELVWSPESGITLRALEIHPAEVGEEVTPWHTPRGGVTAAVVRALKLGELLQNAAVALQHHADFRGWELANPSDGPVTPAHVSGIAAERDAARRTAGGGTRLGRPPKSDVEFQRLAHVCLSLADQGFTRAPIRRLAELERVHESTAKKWVAELRRRGLLAPSLPGRVQFLPGPNLSHRDEEER
jgi:hypothetical protein